MTKQLLLEATPTTLSIVEARGADGKPKKFARGEFGRTDEATANGRSYPKTIIEREIKRLSGDLKARRVLGELDHPQDGKTSLKRVSHVLTKLWIDDSGIIQGEAEILPTPEGRTLQALIESNVQIGVSSRGFGSTKPIERDGKTIEEVGDDYTLKTFDFVCEPAMRTAYPAVYTEDVNAEQPDPSDMFIEAFPDVVRQIREEAVQSATKDEDLESTIRAEMEERFAKNVSEQILSLRDDVTSQLREQFEHDPDIAGAKAVLAAIAEMIADYHVSPDERAVRDALAAKDEEIVDKDAKLSEAVETAKRATYLLHVERKIGGHPMAGSIRKLFKGLALESLEDVDERLDTILAELPKQEPVAASESEDFVALREENVRLKTRSVALEEKVEDLADRLKDAKLIGEKLDDRRKNAEERVREVERQLTESESAMSKAQALVEDLKSRGDLLCYKHEKVAGLTNGRELMALMEGITDRAKVDELVAMRGTTVVSDAELEKARRSVGRGRPGEQATLEEGGSSMVGGLLTDDPVFGMIGSSMNEASLLAGG